MNISGPQYSKSTIGMRQPRTLLDQNFKLVFIYPFLCDSSLTKYKETIRSFVSVSMLKEIYTSNVLNIISLASNISPLIDNSGNLVDIDDHVSKNLYIDTTVNKRQAQNEVKQELQQRVREKTMYIRRLLDIDPNLKKFKPYMEMITMGNFIDVPIIVGTKGFDIDKYALLFILTVAVADKKLSLSSYTDVERIFNILKNLSKYDINHILDHLVRLPPRTNLERVLDFFDNDSNSVLTNIGKKLLTPITTRLRTRVVPNPKSRTTFNDSDNYPRFTENISTEILKITKNNLHLASVFFKLVMDPESMSKQFGYDHSKGQLKSTFDRINPKIEYVFKDSVNMFTDSLWPTYIQPILSSFFYTITPMTSGINVSDLIIALQNGDNSKNIKGIFGPIINFILKDLKTELNNTLEKSGPNEADRKLELMKQLCNARFSDSTDMLSNIYNNVVRHALTGPDYTLNDHIQFEKTFENELHKMAPQMISIENDLKTILSNVFVNNLLNDRLTNIINDGLNSVITYLNTLNDYPGLSPYIQIENPASIADSHLREYISDSKKQLIFYIRKHIFYLIQYIICKYVNVTKVEIETTKHDVLDSNNYSLIIPLSTVMLIANAYAAKSYRNFIEDSKRSEDDKVKAENPMTLIQHLNDNYVDKIITFIHNQLNVPNLFVIDEYSNTIYYKLMYHSKVNKINLSTMETYIKNVMNMYS